MYIQYNNIIRERNQFKILFNQVLKMYSLIKVLNGLISMINRLMMNCLKKFLFTILEIKDIYMQIKKIIVKATKKHGENIKIL